MTCYHVWRIHSHILKAWATDDPHTVERNRRAAETLCQIRSKEIHDHLAVYRRHLDDLKAHLDKIIPDGMLSKLYQDNYGRGIAGEDCEDENVNGLGLEDEDYVVVNQEHENAEIDTKETLPGSIPIDKAGAADRAGTMTVARADTFSKDVEDPVMAAKGKNRNEEAKGPHKMYGSGTRVDVKALVARFSKGSA